MQWIKKHKRLTGTVAAVSLLLLLFLVLQSFGGDAQLAYASSALAVRRLLDQDARTGSLPRVLPMGPNLRSRSGRRHALRPVANAAHFRGGRGASRRLVHVDWIGHQAETTHWREQWGHSPAASWRMAWLL